MRKLRGAEGPISGLDSQGWRSKGSDREGAWPELEDICEKNVRRREVRDVDMRSGVRRYVGAAARVHRILAGARSQ